MKQATAIMSAVALALLLAAPASAWNWGSDDLTIKSSNNAMVVNNASSTSSTGNNSTMFNGKMFSGNITTGSAVSLTESHLGVNSNITGVNAPCNCYDDVTIKSKNNAFVVNSASSVSETGGNHTFGNGGYYGGGNGNILTGSASSGTGSWAAVNSNVTMLGGGYMPGN